jgi:hypothetical protein
MDKDRTTEVRFRKTSDVKREWPIFEAMVGNRIIFDIAVGEDGLLELLVHEGAVGRIFGLEQLRALIAEGERLIRAEME